VTEVHNGCTREEQLRWLRDVRAEVLAVKREGADIRALTLWAVLGSIDWNVMLTHRAGHYETGLFDIRRRDRPRPTALAGAAAEVMRGAEIKHSVVRGGGWWERDMRYYRKPHHARPEPTVNGEPILITGASGTLGRAFARVCELRGLPYRLTSRAELEIADPGSVDAALERVRPWAVVNTAGYVRVADAEREPERCFRENTEGAANLAGGCKRAGIPLVTFSTDLVFDGRLGRPYVENDAPCPASVYGASKAAAEERVLGANGEALVLRTSAFFGPWDQHNFVFHTLRALAAGQEWRAASDAAVSPTYVPDLVNAALDLLIDGENGIWHLANEGEVTWADLARRAAKRAGFDPERVRLNGAERVRTSTALDSSRGRLMPTLDTALDRFFTDGEQNWAAVPVLPSR
jgi:dTDP-4-dehydrorhamnose reductase